MVVIWMLARSASSKSSQIVVDKVGCNPHLRKAPQASFKAAQVPWASCRWLCKSDPAVARGRSRVASQPAFGTNPPSPSPKP